MYYSIEEIKIMRKLLKDKKYFMPKYFVNISDEMFQKFCNGIGAEFFPKLLRKYLTKLFFVFELAAMVHDVEYGIGGNYWTFTNANLRFITNGVAAAIRLHSFKFACYALLFGILCQIFGYKAFNKKGSTA